MFGKLMKYEMKSLSKGLLPLYGAVIVVAIINSLMFNMKDSMGMDGWAQTTAIVLYTALCVSVAVMTLVIIVQRFHKGLLGQEGYLMFTLPVPTWQLTCSKLLGASIMALLSMIVGIVSVVILGASTIDWSGFFYELREALLNADIDIVLFLLEVLVGMLVNIVASICQIYLAIALGHLANQHRVAMSVVWYIAINTVLTFIAAILENTVLRMPSFTEFLYRILVDWGSYVVHAAMWTGIALALVQVMIFYFATNYILRNKLNLE